MKPRGLKAVELLLAKRACSCCAPTIRKRETGNAEQDIGERLLSEFNSRVRDVISGQVDAVANTLRSSTAGGYTAATEAALAMKDPKWGNLIAEAAKPYITEITRIGGEAGLAVVGSPVASFSTDAPNVQAYVDSAVTRLAEDIRNGTTTRVSDLIGNALNEGRSTAQIADDLTASGYDELRAEMIARTESARAYSAGNIEGWAQSELPIKKAWSPNPGACPFCLAAAAQYGKDSQAIGLRENFYDKGDVITAADGSTMTLDYSSTQGPPLHPACACGMIPVIGD